MNADAADSHRLYDQLDSELNAMIASGVHDPESWFNASTFTVEEARRWDGLGYMAEGALEWSAAFRADKDAVAAWARVGMPDAPVAVLEALTVGLDPIRWQWWRVHGFSHESTVDWSDRRFSLAKALGWVESGLPDPSQAAEWAARSFSVAAAKSWRVAIREVADFASGWVEVGFSPEEAALCRLVGVERPPELADRVPGDLTAAVAAGRVELSRHSWAVNDADAYDATATLAAGASGTPRREAAVTLAALAAVRPRSELLALALSLSRDDDVEVRAHAGRALAVLAQPEEPLEPVAQRRLADLLAEDGLLAPLLVLRALIGVPGGLQPVEVRNRVAGLAEQHPSRLIRKEATRLLAEQEPPTEG